MEDDDVNPFLLLPSSPIINESVARAHGSFSNDPLTAETALSYHRPETNETRSQSRNVSAPTIAHSTKYPEREGPARLVSKEEWFGVQEAFRRHRPTSDEPLRIVRSLNDTLHELGVSDVEKRSAAISDILGNDARSRIGEAEFMTW